MAFNSATNINEEISNSIKSNNFLGNIKSTYFIKKLFEHIKRSKHLEIIKYNKIMQNIFEISINNYREYFETFTPIEIEVIPIKNKKCRFINNISKEQESYIHIYFNEGIKEEKKFILEENEEIDKIKIVIDPQIISFKGLFKFCKFIESIYFKKFNRTNIIDMSDMFNWCSSLKNIRPY